MFNLIVYNICREDFSRGIRLRDTYRLAKGFSLYPYKLLLSFIVIVVNIRGLTGIKHNICCVRQRQLAKTKRYKHDKLSAADALLL
jgi:hypothetical protein